jgi:hypothetical protein
MPSSTEHNLSPKLLESLTNDIIKFKSQYSEQQAKEVIKHHIHHCIKFALPDIKFLELRGLTQKTYDDLMNTEQMKLF